MLKKLVVVSVALLLLVGPLGMVGTASTDDCSKIKSVAKGVKDKQTLEFFLEIVSGVTEAQAVAIANEWEDNGALKDIKNLPDYRYDSAVC